MGTWPARSGLSFLQTAAVRPATAAEYEIVHRRVLLWEANNLGRGAASEAEMDWVLCAIFQEWFEEARRSRRRRRPSPPFATADRSLAAGRAATSRERARHCVAGGVWNRPGAASRSHGRLWL